MFKSKMILGLAAIGMSAIIAVGGTYAWFTSTPTLTSNNFTTGTLTAKLTGSGGATTLDLSAANKLVPGEVMGTPTSITIENTGSANLAWFGKLVFSGNDALKDHIYIDSMKMEFLDPDGVSTWLSEDEFIKDGVGYTGNGAGQGEADWFNSLKDNASGKITLRNFMGNQGVNALGYENQGSLKPGFKYRITFKLGLTGNTDDTLQNQPANLSYKVISTQINSDALENLISGGSIHFQWFSTNISTQK